MSFYSTLSNAGKRRVVLKGVLKHFPKQSLNDLTSRVYGLINRLLQKNFHIHQEQVEFLMDLKLLA